MKKFVIISIFSLLAVCCSIAYYYIYYKSPSGPPPSPSITVKHKDVYILIDTSMSMRGYFRTIQSRGTTIQRFLWNGLIPILSELFPSDTIYFSPFGNEIVSPQPVDSLLNRFRFKKLADLQNTFSATETRLIKVFEKLTTSPYRAFVIITDGIPSVRDRPGPSPKVIEAVRSLIEDKKQYLWLIGLRSEFNGFIYPQCPDQFGRRGPFRSDGKRPVFMWVGAKEKDRGIKIVAKFLERLRSLSQNVDVEFAELSFLDLPEAELSFMEKEDIDIRMVYSKHPTEMRILRNSEYIDVPLRVNWQKERLEKKWGIHFEMIPEDFRGVSIKKQNQRWYLHIIPQRTSTRPLTINLKITPRIEPWWIHWSTDDDSSRENAHQTLYLQPLVGQLVSQYLDRSYNIASVKVIIK